MSDLNGNLTEHIGARAEDPVGKVGRPPYLDLCLSYELGEIKEMKRGTKGQNRSVG